MPQQGLTYRQQFADKIKPIDKEQLRRRMISIAAILGGVWALINIIGVLLPDRSKDDPTPGNNSVPASTLVAGFATDCVKAYTTSMVGDESRIARCVTLRSDQKLPATRSKFTDAQISFLKQVLTDPSGLAIWQAVVSGIPNADTAATPVRVCYQVAVTVLDASPRLVDIPNVVECPNVGVDVRLAYRNDVDQKSQLWGAASGFVSSYLTGGAEYTRYVTSDCIAKPVAPAPYASIALQNIRSDVDATASPAGTAHVRVTFLARTKSNSATLLSSPLTLRAVEGRWQVESVDATPEINLRPEDPRGNSTTTSTTSTTPPPPAARG